MAANIETLFKTLLCQELFVRTPDGADIVDAFEASTKIHATLTVGSGFIQSDVEYSSEIHADVIFDDTPILLTSSDGKFAFTIGPLTTEKELEDFLQLFFAAHKDDIGIEMIAHIDDDHLDVEKIHFSVHRGRQMHEIFDDCSKEDIERFMANVDREALLFYHYLSSAAINAGCVL
jgi:hypothetical protein